MLSNKINKYVVVLTVMVSLPLVAQNEPLTQPGGVVERFAEGDTTTVAKHSPVSTNIPGVAIDGYDPVAYFTQNKAVKGDEALVCDYNGTTWRFSNKEHRDLFLSDPEKYAPQFGGFVRNRSHITRLLYRTLKPLLLRMTSCICMWTRRLKLKTLKENQFSLNC